MLLAYVAADAHGATHERVASVARESARTGTIYHPITGQEATDITTVALRTYTPIGQRGTARCVFPNGTPRPAQCAGRTGTIKWRARFLFRANGTWSYTTIYIRTVTR